MSQTQARPPPLPRGATSYSGWRLAIYDLWVLGVVNTYAWRCATAKYLLPLFRNNVGAKHLDLGVGTGYYLQHAGIPTGTHVALCDLSPTALEAARTRIPPGVEVGAIIEADVLQPLPTDDRYDSASMFFLVHCLPGPVRRKTVVFEHIRRNLTPDGVLTGATVLGPRAGYAEGWFGALIRWFVVRDGIMDNADDDPESLVAALHENFETVETSIVGAVLLWKAQRPKSP
jgi:SAM-dependent methyltransferase